MKDVEIFNLIKKEEARQENTINLIASENYVSKQVLEALGSVLTNKYSEGYSGKRYYGGNFYIDKIEELCQKRALKLFGLSEEKWSVNVQPYSGSPANLAVYSALVPLGEKIMGMELAMGGHLTHGHKVSFSGKAWKQIPFGVNKKTEMLDYGELLRIAKREKPKLIVCGFTAYSRKIDFKKFRQIADSAGAYLMADIAHIAGLIAGKAYPSPFAYADIVTTTTHKTLRGPRGAIIFSRRIKSQISNLKINELIDKAVFPGMQGGPHNHQTVAIAVCLKEAMSPDFKKYAKQIILNARALAQELKNRGWRIVSGGTDSHLFLVDVFKKGITGKEAEELLEEAGIIVNKNAIPFDERSPFNPSGIRIGVPAITTRGMKEKEMKIIAGLIDGILKKELKTSEVKKRVEKLCQKFPL
ncbi:MAG: serine hydroxymethyltransferase [Patescibacteria group bacterium]